MGSSRQRQPKSLRQQLKERSAQHAASAQRRHQGQGTAEDGAARSKGIESDAAKSEVAESNSELPESFAEVARAMGTKPLPSAPTTVAPPKTAAAKRPLPTHKPVPAFVVEDSDGWLDGRRADRAPNHRHSLQQAPIEAELDLHGMRAKDAERALHGFVTRSARQGCHIVRVIVGKGHHRPSGRGVLRECIANWLTDNPSAHVVTAFVSASPHNGGDGAVVLALTKAALEQ